jgi:hypothetical protein
VHEEIAPRNGMHPRTKGAIALGPSGNIQGGFKFMALDTGKKITRRCWDVIPMPDQHRDIPEHSVRLARSQQLKGQQRYTAS